MNVELLAPAGDLEKVKVAFHYGADAVYLGGTMFSLRARASKFTLDLIEEAVTYAHQIDKKIYVTMNIVPHNDDLVLLDDYLRDLERIGVDAVICSSPVIIERAKATTKLEIHLSTQLSVANSSLANFWYEEGVSRVVLARECDLDEIEQIKKNTDAELEVFIHGGMCVSYSGRCTLSNYMTDRDANRGGCAHSCRWKYDLYDEDVKLSEDFDFQMSSKDLQTLEFIPRMLEIGVASLKIEGRMKSIHYIATVVHTYRELIDDYEQGTLKEMSYYQAEIAKAENRQTASGFMEGIPYTSQQIYNQRSEIPTQEFVGVVLEYNLEKKQMLLEQRNYFTVGDEIEIYSPITEKNSFIVQSLTDEFGEVLDTARHPLQHLWTPVPFKVYPLDLVRKVKIDE